MSTSQIQLVFEHVWNNGLLAFIQHASSILCLHLMFQRFRKSCLCCFFLLCYRFIMFIKDYMYQVMAVTRTNICKNGMESLSRGGAVIYYASIFLYFWVFSTPVVSLVFGSYLYICINWFHIHFDEAFSSLRIANYKSFTRFHIKSNGDLEVYTLAVDKVTSIEMYRNISLLLWVMARHMNMCSNFDKRIYLTNIIERIRFSNV